MAQSRFLAERQADLMDAATGSLRIRWAAAQTGWLHDVWDGDRGRLGMNDDFCAETPVIICSIFGLLT
jgi:hypothetical protein